MVSAHFGIPPDFFSLPESACMHSTQTVFLGLLSPQLPLIFVVMSMSTKVASSAWDHLAFGFSTMVLSESMGEQSEHKKKR